MRRAPTTPLRQFRASWVASVVNIDWPSRTGLTAAQQQAELIGWLDDAVRQHHNAVILQVRPTADAFWPSKVEPWSQYLTGTQGGDPGYDPLAFAVAEAHKRNLELHAWFNPYRLSMGTDINALVPEHPARQHPDWVVTYGGKLYYNPGIPAARKLVEDAIMDAVSRYDIDGVHFDDYFYPYPVAGQVFDDAATYAQYGAGFPTLAEWRRNNIDLLIQELQQRIKAVKPWVKFGISPFAVWRNKATDPLGLRHDRRRPDVRRPGRGHPAAGSARSGSTTSSRRSTGPVGSLRPTTTRSCRGGRSRSAAPTSTSTSARRRTRSVRRPSRRTGRTRPS